MRIRIDGRCGQNDSPSAMHRAASDLYDDVMNTAAEARWHAAIQSIMDLRSIWRREPESNRPKRLCRPLHNRFAIAPRGIEPVSKKPRLEVRGFWNLEREKGLEPSTSTLARLRSTN
jgi:hypothetical protein